MDRFPIPTIRFTINVYEAIWVLNTVLTIISDYLKLSQCLDSTNLEKEWASCKTKFHVDLKIKNPLMCK